MAKHKWQTLSRDSKVCVGIESKNIHKLATMTILMNSEICSFLTNDRASTM